MSTKEKLKARVLLIPSDLKYVEMKVFLVSIGFNECNKMEHLQDLVYCLFQIQKN